VRTDIRSSDLDLRHLRIQNGVRPLRVLVVAGGTGGHIFPALAVAEEIVRRAQRSAAPAPQLQFVGTTRGLDSRLIERAGFAYRALPAAGLKGIRGWQFLKNAALLPHTFEASASALGEFRPDVVLGMGGYVAGPVLLEAVIFRIPTIIMEPNASPGFTNRVLAPLITRAALAFEAAAGKFGSKARFTGLPVRRAFFEIPRREHKMPFTILIFGGSQGSSALNRAVMESLPLLASRRWRFIHQAGEREAGAVQKAYEKAHISAQVCTFIDDMPGAFAAADLVISRAGASTLGELLAAGKAALLVPFPGATDQHQLENARALENAGAARVIEQSSLTPERLVAEIDSLTSAPERLKAMEQKARSMAVPDAAARIADLIEELGVASYQRSSFRG
jgi:UDP-N-acetylglucosamine--N-acetylmuramyl-(pentapeptide) pyrophosphoryl-undecaprenol N-acetylglucosamine transferase